MGSSSCLNSTHYAVIGNPKVFSFSGSLSTLLKKKKKSSILFCCHNNGNVRSANGFPSVLTERLVTEVNEDHIIFSTSVKKQEEIGVMDLIPYKGTKAAGALVVNEGIGIARFLKGKRLFITGATGFLAKGDCYKFYVFISVTYFVVFPPLF